MDIYAYTGEVVSSLIYLFVCVRLFVLSRKTGHTPELLVATSFMCWLLSYWIYGIPFALGGAEASVPVAFSYGSLIAVATGNCVFAFFIRSVFRSAERWSKVLASAVVLCNGVGVGGWGWWGDWEGIDPFANPWYWLEWFGSFAPSAWMAAEGFAQYFKSRKQLKLGFSEPMSCNRFLLWGMAGSLWVGLESILTVSDIVYAYTGAWSEAIGVGTAVLDVLPILIVWFVFFPPVYYTRWVDGRAPA
jgi:hypothetical protein